MTEEELRDKTIEIMLMTNKVQNEHIKALYKRVDALEKLAKRTNLIEFIKLGGSQ